MRSHSPDPARLGEASERTPAMSHQDAGPTVSAPTSSHRGEVPEEPTLWAGWIAFAGCMMMLIGTFQAIEGLLALFREDYFLVRTSQMVVQVDWTTWGWIHLSLGVLVACAGGALMAGRTWAQVVAILFAFVSAIVNLAFLPAYPIWSTMMI